jgi:hypothetical protein
MRKSIPGEELSSFQSVLETRLVVVLSRGMERTGGT